MNTSHSTPAELACADVYELLPEFLGGELDSAVAQAIERHAQGCPTCARELAESRAAIGLVRRAAAAQPKQKATPIRFRNSTPATPWRPLAVAACLAIAFGLGMVAGRTSIAPSVVAHITVPEAIPAESIATRYRQAATTSPHASSLGLAMMSIARRE